MLRKIASIIFIAGNFIFISACNESVPSDKKEGTLESNTTGSTTSAGTQAPSSEMMKTLNENMQEMKEVKLTGDPDLDFASLMEVHHKGEISMVESQAAKGQNQELVKIANNMKPKKEMEMKELKSTKSSLKAKSSNKEFKEEINKVMKKGEEDINKMTSTGNVDTDFANMMVLHHEIGMDLSKAQMKYGKDQKVKNMAQKMMEDSKKEIKIIEKFEEKKM